MKVLFKRHGDHIWTQEEQLNFVPRVGEHIVFGDDANVYTVHKVAWLLGEGHHFDATVTLV